MGGSQGHTREQAVTEPALNRLFLIADDVGRLRRLGVEHYALERMAHNLDSLDAMLRPSAGQLVREGLSVHDALGVVDRQRAALLWKVGHSPT